MKARRLASGIERNAGENDESRGHREPQGENQSPTPDRKITSFKDAIKQLFRDVKAAVTEKPPEPQQTTRRRSRGETGSAAFKMAASNIMHRAARIPAEAYATATAYLMDTLDWLNQWHHHDDDQNEDFRAASNDHLYPHL